MNSKVDIVKDLTTFVSYTFPCSNEVALFIACQICLETGYLSSSLFKSNNNLFGMRLPKKRLTTAKSESNGHSVYDGFGLSMFDYLLWLSYNRFLMSDCKSLGLFCAKMRKSNFNPSDTYVDTIMKLYKLYYDEVFPPESKSSSAS